MNETSASEDARDSLSLERERAGVRVIPIVSGRLAASGKRHALLRLGLAAWSLGLLILTSDFPLRRLSKPEMREVVRSGPGS